MDKGHITNLVMVCSRGRPQNVIRCFEVLKKLSHISDYILVISEDQKDLYPEIEGVQRLVAPLDAGTGSCDKGNYLVAQKIHEDYETLSCIDDDTVVETDGWDLYLALPLKAKGYGVSWGNDGIHQGQIPTKWTMTTNIVSSLGFIAPPGLIHLYVDNLWHRIGEVLNSAHYAPSVLMTHHHWINKKAPMDATYAENNTKEVWAHDEKVFTEYITGQFHEDIERIKKDLKIA